jgi:uncharacterized protein
MYNKSFIFQDAVRRNSIKIIKFFINNNLVDINDVSHHSNALIIATIYGYTEIIKILLANGADVNLMSVDGQTPLMWAARNGKIETAKLLIANGADVNKQSGAYNALEVAVVNGNKEIANLLKQVGAK